MSSSDFKKPGGLKAGQLYKSSLRMKRWNLCFCVLEYKDLIYYKNDQYDASQSKTIPLKSQCSVLEADVADSKRPHSFKLAVQNRTYVFSAESRAIMEDWIHAIRSVAGLHVQPSLSNVQSQPNEQMLSLLASVGNTISLCSKVGKLIGECDVPGLADLPQLAAVGEASIKCAYSVRVVVYRPNIQTAQQQLVSALTDIMENTILLESILRKVSQARGDESVDNITLIIETLIKVSSEMVARCMPREELTEMENLLMVGRATINSTNELAEVAGRSPVDKLVEVAKSLKENITSLYDMASASFKKTGHEQPKQAASVARARTLEFIQLCRDCHLEHSSQHRANVSKAAEVLINAVSDVVTAAQAAEQHLMLEEQLADATKTIQESAGSLRTVANQHARRHSLIAQTRTRSNSFWQTDSETARRVIEVATTATEVADVMLGLSNAVKALSKGTLFTTAKSVGMATSSLVHVTLQFTATYPSNDPNFQQHMNDSIRGMQAAGLQLLGSIKNVIQTNFGVPSNVFQMSGAACSHAQGLTHVLEAMKIHITPQRSLRGETITMGRSATMTRRPSNPMRPDLFQSSDGGSQFSSAIPTPVSTLGSSGSSLNVSFLSSVSSPNSSSLAASRAHSSSASSFFITRSNSLKDDKPLAKSSSRHLLDLLDDESDEDDVNIWNEPSDSDENLLLSMEDGETTVRAGTLNKLVIRLTSEKDHDINFQKTFITTYRSFTTPHKLFRKLLQRYNVTVPKLPPAISATEYHKRSVLPIQVRVANVIKQLVDVAFHDINDSLIAKIKNFTDTVLLQDGNAALARQISLAIAKQLAARESMNSLFANGIIKSEPTVSSVGLEGYSEEEIAQQMTLLDFNLYAQIKPVELLNLAWAKNPLKHRAPNVLAIAERFNIISAWAASVVLWQQSVKERVNVWVRLVNIIEFLLKLNNFNTALAIMAGINNSATHRLKFTRAELPKKTQVYFESVMQLLNSEKTWKIYRETLHNVNPPCLPYLGMYQTDLTFIEDGNPDLIGELINFKKRTLISDVIAEVQLYQQIPYTLTANEKLIAPLKNLPYCKEDQLYQMSLLREPRNAEREDIE